MGTIILVLLCMICFVAHLKLGNTFISHLIPSSGNLTIFNIFGYMFCHRELDHLSWNMAMLIMFGWVVERYLGFFYTILLFISSGALGLCLFTFLSVNAVIGASFGIFGLIGAYCVILGLEESWVLFLFPIPLRLSGIVFGMGLAISEFCDYFNCPEDNTAHDGHLCGMLMGALIGWFLWDRKSRQIVRNDVQELQNNNRIGRNDQRRNNKIVRKP